MRIKLFPDDMLPQEKAIWVLMIVLCVLIIIFTTLYLIILPSSIPPNAFADVLNSTITTLNGAVS